MRCLEAERRGVALSCCCTENVTVCTDFRAVKEVTVNLTGDFCHLLCARSCPSLMHTACVSKSWKARLGQTFMNRCLANAAISSCPLSQIVKEHILSLQRLMVLSMHYLVPVVSNCCTAADTVFVYRECRCTLHALVPVVSTCFCFKVKTRKVYAGRRGL